jgi:hypothetical protein
MAGRLLLGLGLGLALVGCGATSTQGGAHPSPSPTAPAGGLTLSRLSSLSNYTFTTTSSNGGATFTIRGQVHGPEDWKVESTIPVAETHYDVGGRGYAVTLGQVMAVTFATPEGLSHLNGEYSAAQSLLGYTHVLGETISTAGSCRVAGETGTVYHLRSPENASSLLVETATACVAKGSGALLSYAAGVPSGSAAQASNIAGFTYTFTVDSIGGVGEISAPPQPAPTPTLPAPPVSSGPPQLPAGFPSQVAAPPGTVVSSAQVSSSKWYVQLSESGPAAISQYQARLESQGFSVLSSTSSAGTQLVTLTKGQYQVLLEQTSFSGQGGVMLTVIVQS